MRRLRSLGLGILLLSTVLVAACATSATAQSNLTIAELRQKAEEIANRGSDSAALKRAKQFLDLTEKRLWTYESSKGQLIREDVFDRQEERNGSVVVMFKSRAYVPLQLLSAEDRSIVENLSRLRTEIVRDLDAQRRAEQERQLADQKAREDDLKRMSIRRVRVRRPTYVDIEVDGRTIERSVVANEVFDVLAETNRYFKVEAGGRSAMIAKADVTEITPTLSGDSGPRDYTVNRLNPTDGAPSLPPDADGGKKRAAIQLDMDTNIVQRGDQILVEAREVFRGGLADRKGIRTGELIELVDDRRIRSWDELRTRLLDGPPIKFHVRNPATNVVRIIRVDAENPARRVELGADGFSSADGGYVIRFVYPGDNLARRLRLRAGDKLVWLNGETVRGGDDVSRALRGATEAKAIIIPRDSNDQEERQAQLDEAVWRID